MISILNAAPDTGNQGVSALCMSAVAGLVARNIGPVAVADHGKGHRQADWGFAKVDLIGLSNTRRYWRSENLVAVRALARMGGLYSPTARVIARSKAILDVSGGDSFTDLYGPKRFRTMVLSKQLALDSGKKLILLPQTLGPFNNAECRAEAVEILKAADAVWLRDKGSYKFMQDMLGKDFNPEKHRLGLDMAVALPQVAPKSGISDTVMGWLNGQRDFPVIGLNVSGLLSMEPEAAQKTFRLADRHDRQLEVACRAVLNLNPTMRLLLVPHVHQAEGAPESDLSASRDLKARLGAEYADRIEIIESRPNAMELKWILARLDWFAGARMHATIGAFSSGTPTLGLGYSDKAAGVFDQCGIGDHVADLRLMDAAALARAVVISVGNREETRVKLAGLVAGLRQRAEAQMDAIAAQIEA
jgi:polysaccharide pyruvyl transferase WcaK-like protein